MSAKKRSIPPKDFSALMADVLSGRITPEQCNRASAALRAALRAGEQLAKLRRMELRHLRKFTGKDEEEKV